jgi:hypothetical protein
MILKQKYPRVDDLVYNDQVLYLVADPYHLTNPNPIPFGFGNTAAVVVPRVLIDVFRHTFVTTFEKAKYRRTTMRHFKYLNRRYVFDHHGEPIERKWDLKMDSFNFKKIDLTDDDRVVIMPNSWVAAATACKAYELRQLAYNNETSGYAASDTKALSTFGLKFFDFPPFIVNN